MPLGAGEPFAPIRVGQKIELRQVLAGGGGQGVPFGALGVELQDGVLRTLPVHRADHAVQARTLGEVAVRL